MTILYITSLTAEALAAKLTNYLESTEMEYRKLIGQGGQPGKDTGVQKKSTHTLWPCIIHSLLLPSASVSKHSSSIQHSMDP